MIDQNFVNELNKSVEAMSRLVNQIPNEIKKNAHLFKEEDLQKINDSIKHSDIKGKIREFETQRADLEATMKKYL